MLLVVHIGICRQFTRTLKLPLELEMPDTVVLGLSLARPLPSSILRRTDPPRGDCTSDRLLLVLRSRR